MSRLANYRPKPAKGFPYKKTGFGARHVRNPAGTKAVLRFYKAHHGVHADNPEQAFQWYATVHADKEAAVLKAEKNRKLARIKRNHAWLADRLPEAA